MVARYLMEGAAGAGIKRGLVRLSIGISGSLEQRWAQLKEALDHIKGT